VRGKAEASSGANASHAAARRMRLLRAQLAYFGNCQHGARRCLRVLMPVLCI